MEGITVFNGLPFQVWSTSYISRDLLGTGLLLAVIAVIFRLKRGHTRYPPGPKPLPFLGNIFDLPKSGEQEWHFWAKHKQLYGPISSIQVFGNRIVIVNDADIAFDMFEKHAVDFSDRPNMIFGNEIVGYKDSPINLNYTPLLRQHRKHYHRLIGTKASCSNFDSLQSVEIRRLLLQILESPNNLRADIRATVGTIIMRATFGYVTERRKPDPAIKIAEQLSADFGTSIQPGRWLVDYFPILRYVPSWVPGGDFKRVAQVFRKTLEESLDRPLAFVKMQMEAGVAEPSLVTNIFDSLGGDPTAEEEDTIKWNAAAFYGAGADTSVSLISSFYLAMALFPKVQRNAQEEIDRVVGNDRFPSVEDRKRLPYIDAIVREVLRWHPVVPLGVPHAVARDNIYNGYFIPKGSIVVPNIWNFTHDPARYHEPMEFKPERFFETESRAPEMDPHMLSFGFGRRICPGREFADTSLYLNIAMSLSVFNITKPLGSSLEARFTASMLSHPEEFKVDIIARSTKAESLIRSVEVEHPYEASDSEAFMGVKI
ncbi:cytochrome P450 [Pyrrhoderma noxium]|uniref:Cytochrome P450 n=1 Tax=Pyrrhoderma noxium TaxID=2282107 RepID=A0A286UDE2_9AGAM|nr:cytochrome P450 [Pyrrhoderma noxium]